jgi:hypothetical protein
MKIRRNNRNALTSHASSTNFAQIQISKINRNYEKKKLAPAASAADAA